MSDPGSLDELTVISFSGEIIYFVQAGTAGPIKIGRTAGYRLWNRIAELQTGQHEQLYLLMIAAGGSAMEAALHRELAKWKIRGEWFDSRALDALNRHIAVAQWFRSTSTHPAVAWFGLPAGLMTTRGMIDTDALSAIDCQEIVKRLRAARDQRADPIDRFEAAVHCAATHWERNPEYSFGQALHAAVNAA